MAKVTTKLQVTVPKAIAEQYGIHPGDDIEWVPAGEAVRVHKKTRRPPGPVGGDIARRLEFFDLATERQHTRQKKARRTPAKTRDRGWRREDVYERGHPR